MIGKDEPVQLNRSSVPNLDERRAAFAARFDRASDICADIPELGKGRLEWIRNELVKLGHKVTKQTVRKWYAGEAEPRPPKMEALAQILQVNLVWLQTGIDGNRTHLEQFSQESTVDGLINLLAGLIRMDGSTSVFPADDDNLAKRENIHIYATIKTTQYRLHVALAEPLDSGLKFILPIRHSDVIVIGVERATNFGLRLYQVPTAIIDQYGDRRGGSIELTVDDPEAQLKPIRSFAEKL